MGVAAAAVNILLAAASSIVTATVDFVDTNHTAAAARAHTLLGGILRNASSAAAWTGLPVVSAPSVTTAEMLLTLPPAPPALPLPPIAPTRQPQPIQTELELRSALAAAEAANVSSLELLVAPGTRLLLSREIELHRGQRLVLRTATVQDPSQDGRRLNAAADAPWLDAQGSSRLFNLYAAHLEIDGIHLTGGRVPAGIDGGNGGAVQMRENASFVLHRGSISNSFVLLVSIHNCGGSLMRCSTCLSLILLIRTRTFEPHRCPPV